MRTTTAGELAVLGSLDRNVALRFKVQNGSGTMIDLTARLQSIKPDEDIDRPIAGLTVELMEDDAARSLSPFRTDSTLNRLDDGVTYSPLLDLNRIVTFEPATTAIGAPISSTDHKLLFKGTIDIINFEHRPISVVCRDLGAPLVDRYVETEANYGTGGGRAIELVKQDILDASFGAGVVPVITIGTPAFSIVTYQQQKMSLSDAEQALDQLRGWDSRYWWGEGTGTFRYTFQEPPRTKTTPDYTFGPKDYYDVRALDLDLTGIKNVVQVSFRDSANQGNRAVVTVSDAPSIAKYGRRFLFMQEADSSPIDTSAEATAMANAALSDLKEPKASLEIELPFFWPCQLWDLYRFSANGKHFNTDQDLAVSSYSHELSPNRHRTIVKLRGKPAGGYAIWLQRGGVIGGGVGGGTQAFAPYPYISPRNTEASDTMWDLRFTATNGSGGGGANLTYTITSKKTFGTETTLDSGNALAFPKDLTVTRDPKQDQVIKFTVTDAATGMVAFATYVVPAFVLGISVTGTIIGAQIDANSVGPTQTQVRFNAKVFHSTTNAITTATWTALAFDSEIYDNGALHSTSVNNSRITIPTGGASGNWLLTATVEWAFNTTGFREVQIIKNGSLIMAWSRVSAMGATAGNVMSLTGMADFPAVGDYFEVFVRQDSGGNLNVTGNSTFAAIYLW